MDFKELKEIITSFILKFYILFKKNINIVILVVVIVIVVLISYYFSEKNRISRKLNYINNSLVYDKPRRQMNYCGDIEEDVIKDVYIKKDNNYNIIEVYKKVENEDEDTYVKIDLWTYNLSSEYVIEIIGKTDSTYDNLINQPYKVKNIDPIDSHKLILMNEPKIPNLNITTSVGSSENNDYVLVDLKYYNINPNNVTNPYKHKRLCEYYICSSYNCFLIGNQIFDYCSLEMIQKNLYFGSRYLEIPIYDKEKKHDTIPIVFSGLNNIRLTFNYLEVEKVFETIAKYAFNFRFLDNSSDPLFLYLDIKTTNIKTLDKVYDYLIKYLNIYLLDSSYNHSVSGSTKLCDITKKCVILSSSGYQGSKLDQLVNCSSSNSETDTDNDNDTDTEKAINPNNLKRITYNEALLNASELKAPKLKLSSNRIRFMADNVFKDSIEIYDKNINLFNYGIVKGDGVLTSGSKNALNNSSGGLYKIFSITKTKIVFEPGVTLTTEEMGEYITLEVYDKDNNKEQLEEYNKNKLTIVIPDSKRLSSNYNYKNILNKGCQFITMNFQTIDKYMLDYFNYFKLNSFKFKPRVLINNISIPKSVSINSMVPVFKTDINLDIDYNFLDKLRTNRISNITPFNNKKLKLIGSGENNRHVKFNLDYNSNNSTFKIVPGLNKRSGYVSFQLNDSEDRYLTYQECGCYLYFTKAHTASTTPANDKDKKIIYEFNDKASFIALNPVKSVKDYNSFGVIKTIKSKTSETDALFYLKIRSKLNTNKKLFVKEVNRYETKMILKQNETDYDLVVLKPIFNAKRGFFPTGDIVVRKDRLETLTLRTGQAMVVDNLEQEVVYDQEYENAYTTNEAVVDADAVAPKTQSEALANPTPSNDLVPRIDIKTLSAAKTAAGFALSSGSKNIYERTDNNSIPYCTGGLELGTKLGSSAVEIKGCYEKCDINETKIKDSDGTYKCRDSNDILGPSLTPQISVLKYSCPTGYDDYNDNFFTNPDEKCYRTCKEGYKPTFDLKNCIKKKLKARNTLPDNTNYISGQQKFKTQLFSGAVDKPIDFELIWDNKDTNNNDEEELSIWKPIPNDGFMEMGHVFVKGYNKPSREEVVCISVDYIREETISGDIDSIDTATPLYFNTEKQLAIWNIQNHNYAKAYPFVGNETDKKLQIPNSIEFKIYDFITKEVDYYDKLYLDNNISSDKEKESTLLKISFDSLPKSAGGDVYDYLMKLENSNGKLLSYTPSESGRKMCMALPQPYWSSFYDEVTSDKTTFDIIEETEEIENPKVKFEACKSRDYFGTNWNIYQDNTIRLEGNKDACLTYKGDQEKFISVDINDSNNYLYLDKCGNNTNQKFEFVNNNIKVQTDTEYDPNACLTHTPEDNIRLEECGDRTYTVVSKWNNRIARVDTCNKIDAETEMKNIGAMEMCQDLSYYIVYLGDGLEHTHEEFCSYKDAETEYNKVKTKYRRGIAIINKGKILLSKTNTNSSKLILKNYAFKLKNMKGVCLSCKYPSKVLCVNNTVTESEYTRFENDKEKKEISEYCANLKADSNFKCSRGYRQKFINNIHPNDYCIDYFKEVWVYIYSSSQYSDQNFTLDVSRKSVAVAVADTAAADTAASNQAPDDQGPSDNLLGEIYDSEHYHLFLKGTCVKSPDETKFRIIFDIGESTIKNYLDLYKFSNDIILNYVPNYDSIEIGTKVLATLGYQEGKDLINKTKIDSNEAENFSTANKVNLTNVKWLAVVIDKLKNNKVEVMFSINSYETQLENFPDSYVKKRPYSNTNIRKIYNVNDLVLLKKAPLCV